jgi:hypothetical protein
MAGLPFLPFDQKDIHESSFPLLLFLFPFPFSTALDISPFPLLLLLLSSLSPPTYPCLLVEYRSSFSSTSFPSFYLSSSTYSFSAALPFPPTSLLSPPSPLSLLPCPLFIGRVSFLLLLLLHLLFPLSLSSSISLSLTLYPLFFS